MNPIQKMRLKRAAGDTTESQSEAKKQLRQIAEPRCRKCYGLGYTARQAETGKLILCDCAARGYFKVAQAAAEIKAQEALKARRPWWKKLLFWK